MPFWVVRAGRHGEQEQGALEHNVVTIAWNELPDLSSIRTRDDLMKLSLGTYPSVKKMKAANEVGQIWRFAHEIKKGDLVALPLKSESSISIGTVEGEYEYAEIAWNIRHIRRVKWLKKIPRSAFDQDLLYSIGAYMTVSNVTRNNAEYRIKELLRRTEYGTAVKEAETTEEAIEEETIDIEQYAEDQIIKYIAAKFKGHNLARLVDAILAAQGYVTRPSDPGPDGGVDILASSGPLGFDHPRICVQVKSTSSQVDVKVLRELRGVMDKVGAESGLLVSWSGFTNSAKQEARDTFFRIRLWDAGELLEAIFRHYNKFTDELKAEFPLKRIWALVQEEE